MAPVTYIIASPPGLGHDPAATTLAAALGCTERVAEWDGIAPLTPGACAFVSVHHTPPAHSCVVQIGDADDLREMADALTRLEMDPPHISFALLRVLHGISSGRSYRQLGEYHHALRQRVIDAERLAAQAEQCAEMWHDIARESDAPIGITQDGHAGLINPQPNNVNEAHHAA